MSEDDERQQSLPSDLEFVVRRLLCSARPVAIQTSANPSASDQDLQQAQLWQLAQRTTALPLGRGAFTLATIYTLLTEAFTVPKLVLAGRLPAQQNATVNLDPSIRNIQELKSWPEFHNAVAAGLRLAPLQSFHCGHGKAYLFDKVVSKYLKCLYKLIGILKVTRSSKDTKPGIQNL
ncbi:hypothetical protein V6Z11_A08G200400 [Gossypium hirsutum]